MTYSLFGNAGKEYLNENKDMTKLHFAKIALTNRKHGLNNPYAL